MFQVMFRTPPILVRRMTTGFSGPPGGLEADLRVPWYLFDVWKSCSMPCPWWYKVDET